MTRPYTLLIYIAILSFLLPLPIQAKWKPGTVLTAESVRQAGVETFFSVNTIDDELFQRMQRGGSYPKNCTISREDLRYLHLLHVNFKGETITGELVCNKAIASDLIDIFRKLYESGYPIEHVQLIDDFGAQDETSMRANNTSCFCFRTKSGTKSLSLHARGLAIDVNPLQNPCVKRNKDGSLKQIQPNCPEAKACIERKAGKNHMITKSDLCYKLFIQHGFSWGGAWRSLKDYQHFEKK